MMYKKVLLLAAQMFVELDRNSFKHGWSTCSNKYLYKKLNEEIAELKVAVRSGNKDVILSEAADAANFIMMITDNAGAFDD